MASPDSLNAILYSSFSSTSPAENPPSIPRKLPPQPSPSLPPSLPRPPVPLANENGHDHDHEQDLDHDRYSSPSKKPRGRRAGVFKSQANCRKAYHETLRVLIGANIIQRVRVCYVESQNARILKPLGPRVSFRNEETKRKAVGPESPAMHLGRIHIDDQHALLIFDYHQNAPHNTNAKFTTDDVFLSVVDNLFVIDSDVFEDQRYYDQRPDAVQQNDGSYSNNYYNYHHHHSFHNPHEGYRRHNAEHHDYQQHHFQQHHQPQGHQDNYQHQYHQANS